MRGEATIWAYIKNYKFNSIFIRNFFAVLFLLMVPLGCVHALVYMYNDANMREEISRAAVGELTRIRDTVDNMMAEAESLGIRLGNDPDVELFLAEEKFARYPLDYSTIGRIRRIQDVFGISVLTNPYVNAIRLYAGADDQGYLLTPTSGGTLDKYDHGWWYDDYAANRDRRSFWVSTLRQPGGHEPEGGSYSLVLFRQLPIGRSAGNGVLMLSIGAEQLEPMLKEITRDQEIYIVDREGTVVYAQDQSLIHRTIEAVHPEWPRLSPGLSFADIVHEDGADRVVSAIPSARGEWSYLSSVPLELYESRRSRLYSFIVLLFSVGIASGLIIAFVISVKTYQPIRGILSLLEHGRSPWERQKQSSASVNELKSIAATIIRSREQKKELEEELERRWTLMSKAQAVALQAQINPHMLFNTLEAINWKVMRLTNGKNEASAMIHSLSRLLRLSLSTGDNIIPLREEIEHARLYLEMERLQRKDLEVNWKINGSILDNLTVKLTLQPIIENAIQHGIKPSGRPGLISIIGYEETQAVVLKIKDNGVGVGQAAADKLNQSFRSDEIKENEHIGLRNVNQRLRLIFGAPYGLHVAGKEGEGTIVEMRLPRQQEVNAHTPFLQTRAPTEESGG